jgi:hypothetical protein
MTSGYGARYSPKGIERLDAREDARGEVRPAATATRCELTEIDETTTESSDRHWRAK